MSLREDNPYDAWVPSQVTQLEADVLFEYAKLADLIKEVVVTIKQATETPDVILSENLRVVETKMGLVLTLFKASVWGSIHYNAPVEDEDDYDEADTPRAPHDQTTVSNVRR